MPEPSVEPRPHPLLSIHYLRAVAAVMVVLYHIYSHGLLTVGPAPYLAWLKQGVAIFFVISGVVMVVSTSGRPRTPMQFLGCRLRRIVPLYWFTTLAWAAVYPPDDWGNLARSLLFLPSIDHGTGVAGQPVLSVGWSLNFEMLFYLLFAAVLLVPRRFGVPALCAVLALLPFAHSWVDFGPTAEWFMATVLLDFVAGVVIAHLGLRAPAWCLPLGFAALALMHEASGIRFLDETLPAVLIVASARSLDGRLTRRPLPSLLGDASYAIYLVHLFVISIAYFLVKSNLGGPSSLALLALPVSVWAGVMLHRTVELPLARLAARIPPPAAWFGKRARLAA